MRHIASYWSKIAKGVHGFGPPNQQKYVLLSHINLAPLYGRVWDISHWTFPSDIFPSNSSPGQFPSPLTTFPRLLTRKFENWH